MMDLIDGTKGETMRAHNKLNVSANVNRFVDTRKNQFHFHKQIKILLALDDSFVICIEGNEYELKKDDIFIVNTDAVYYTPLDVYKRQGVRTADGEDVAQVTVLHQVFQVVGHGIKTVMEIDRVHEAGFPGPRDQGARVFDTCSHGLFAQYVYAVVKGVHRNIKMRIVGRADMHGVQLHLVDHGLVVFKISGYIQFLGGFLRHEFIRERHHIDIAKTAQRLDMHLADKACSHNTNPEYFSHNKRPFFVRVSCNAQEALCISIIGLR